MRDNGSPHRRTVVRDPMWNPLPAAVHYAVIPACGEYCALTTQFGEDQ